MLTPKHMFTWQQTKHENTCITVPPMVWRDSSVIKLNKVKIAWMFRMSFDWNHTQWTGGNQSTRRKHPWGWAAENATFYRLKIQALHSSMTRLTCQLLCHSLPQIMHSSSQLPLTAATHTSKLSSSPHYCLFGLVVRCPSALRVADLGSIPALALDLFLGQVIPVT